MAARSPAALLLAAALLLGAALCGCSTPAGGRAGAQPATRQAPASSAAADSFRSARSYQSVPQPVRVRIPKAGVDSVLVRVGRAADGAMALPSPPGHAGWYAEGPRPGQPGPAVIIGHVKLRGSPSVFFRLHELQAGDLVYVERADRSTARFRVTRLTRVPKSRFPTELVFAPTLEPSLRLVTCGGSVDLATGSHRDNVIVFAVPA
jgi:sortase (surface protein transpeptidase)